MGGVEGLEDVDIQPTPARVQETAQATKAPEVVVSGKESGSERDPDWTNDEIVDLDGVPESEFTDMKLLLEEEDAGREFETVGKDEAEDFEVIIPSADNGFLLRGRLNPRRYLGR